MKKKIFLAILALSLPSVVYAEDSLENSHEVDGVTVTAKNYYISDYTSSDETYDRMVCVDFVIQNETDAPIGYTTRWNCYTTDNVQLESYFDLFNLDTTFVMPNSEITDTACFLLEKDQEITDELIAVYDFMDYDDEYWKDFGAAIFGQISEDEWFAKYSDVTELNYHLTLSDVDAQNPEEFSYSYDGYTYTYVKNEVVGNEILIYFTYANESGSTSYPDSSLSIRAFQNGIELTGLMAGWDNVPTAEENASKAIQNDTTVEVAFRYQLADDTDVALEITPFSYSNTTPIGKYTFSIADH